MCRRTAATQQDSNAFQLITDRASMNVQLDTDLAQRPALGV